MDGEWSIPTHSGLKEGQHLFCSQICNLRYSSSLLHVVSAGAAHGLLRGRWQKENCLYELAWKSSAVTSVAAIHQEGHGVPCTFKGGGIDSTSWWKGARLWKHVWDGKHHCDHFFLKYNHHRHFPLPALRCVWIEHGLWSHSNES